MVGGTTVVKVEVEVEVVVARRLKLLGATVRAHVHVTSTCYLTTHCLTRRELYLICILRSTL